MIVFQNFASKLKRPLKTSCIKFLKVIFFPLLACPQSGQNFSCPLKGYPQFKHSGSFILLTLFLDLASLIIQELLVEKLVQLL